MLRYMTKISLSELLKKLQEENLINSQELDLTYLQQKKKELPLAIRGLIGVGAFISCIYFINYLREAEIIDPKNSLNLLTSGVIFILAALGAEKITQNKNTFWGSLFIQSSFTFIAIGKTLVVWGFSHYYNSPWGTTLGLFLITIITYPVYKMSLDRFLSTYGLLFSFWFSLISEDFPLLLAQFLFHGFFLFQLLGIAFLWFRKRVKDRYNPMAYALLLSILSIIFFSSLFPPKIGFLKDINFNYTNIFLTLGLLVLLIWNIKEIKKFKKSFFIYLAFGIILLGITSNPGILFIMILFILGYARHDKIILGVGYFFTPIFIFFYYYNLQTTLLNKSQILLISGLLLLIYRFFFKKISQGS